MRITRKAGKIAALKQTTAAMDGAKAKIGWFPSAVYENGAPVAGVAHVQEFGSPARGIPPRLGMRATAAEKRGEWAKNTADLTRQAAQGKMDPSQIMDAVAMAAEGAVREAITKVNAPALAEATIAARKRRLANGGRGAKASIAKPLVDTGILLNTLSSEVVKK